MPGSFVGGVGGAAPEVDGEFAVDPDGDGGADFVAFAEVCFEGIADVLETGGAGAIDGDSQMVVHEPPDDGEPAQCGTVPFWRGCKKTVFRLQLGRVVATAYRPPNCAPSITGCTRHAGGAGQQAASDSGTSISISADHGFAAAWEMTQ